MIMGFTKPIEHFNLQRKKVITMNTLYVGIDVSSKSNVVYLMLPNGDKHSNFSVANSHEGSTLLVKKIYSALTSHSLDTVLIGLEATSVYGDNLVYFLREDATLAPFNRKIHVLNPKQVKKFHDTYNDLPKNDYVDSFVIADCLRFGRINKEVYMGEYRYKALQNLTRARFFAVQNLVKEKQRFMNVLFKKYSTMTQEKVFSDAFSTTALAVYDEFESAEALANMGLSKGNVLEPSCGVGNFMGLVPDSMEKIRMYGVELDSISGRIAQQLYQKNKIAVQGFETMQFPDSFFDCVVGNVPFGNYKVPDKRYDRHNFLIHDYFIAKSLDLVRPGGVVAVVTSSGTMDKKDSSVREYLANRADLVGAIRLPNNAFQRNANTGVVADILFLQKRDRAAVERADWVDLGETPEGYSINQYFAQHPEMVLGEITTISTIPSRKKIARRYPRP